MKSGADQLRAWLRRSGLTQRQCAAELGVHESFMTLMLSGARLPGRNLAVKIDRLMGIPVAAWVSSTHDTADAPDTAPAHKRTA